MPRYSRTWIPPVGFTDFCELSRNLVRRHFKFPAFGGARTSAQGERLQTTRKNKRSAEIHTLSCETQYMSHRQNKINIFGLCYPFWRKNRLRSATSAQAGIQVVDATRKALPVWH